MARPFNFQYQSSVQRGLYDDQHTHFQQRLTGVLLVAGIPASDGAEHATPLPTALPLGNAHACHAASGKPPVSCTYSSHCLRISRRTNTHNLAAPATPICH